MAIGGGRRGILYFSILVTDSERCSGSERKSTIDNRKVVGLVFSSVHLLTCSTALFFAVSQTAD